MVFSDRGARREEVVAISDGVDKLAIGGKSDSGKETSTGRGSDDFNRNGTRRGQDQSNIHQQRKKDKTWEFKESATTVRSDQAGDSLRTTLTRNSSFETKHRSSVFAHAEKGPSHRQQDTSKYSSDHFNNNGPHRGQKESNMFHQSRKEAKLANLKKVQELSGQVRQGILCKEHQFVTARLKLIAEVQFLRILKMQGANSRNTDSRVDLAGANKQASSFPLISISSAAVVSIKLHNDVVIELNVNNGIRIVCSGEFSASVDGNGTSACIMHQKARIYQSSKKVFAELGDGHIVVFGPHGIIFTMKQLYLAHIVSCSHNPPGAMPIPAREVFFPLLNTDVTLNLFCEQTKSAKIAFPLCNDIVRNAQYETDHEGVIYMNINGIFIKQQANGDVQVCAAPRFINLSPTALTISVRTRFIDMGVQKDNKCYIKRGGKRVHVSQSGIVVSDGSCITSMDNMGRIVSNRSSFSVKNY